MLESSLRSSPSDEPGRVADFVIDAMTSGVRSSDDIVVLAARRLARRSRADERGGLGRRAGLSRLSR